MKEWRELEGNLETAIIYYVKSEVKQLMRSKSDACRVGDQVRYITWVGASLRLAKSGSLANGL